MIDCATALLSHFVGLRSRFAVRSVRQRLDYIAAVSRGADSEADDSTEPNAIDDLAFIIVQGAREISKDAQALLGRGGVDSKSGRDDSASGGDSTFGGGIGGVSDMQFRGRGTAGRDTTGGGAMRNGPTPGNVAISIKGGKGKKVGGMSGLSLDIDRLFAKKVSVFSAPKFSCSSLLQEFFCVVFKALSEHVREHTLVRAAFQEVQLIARFLFDMMPVFVGDNTEALDALLAEFVNSAHTRCLDQAPGMSEHAVDNR